MWWVVFGKSPSGQHLKSLFGSRLPQTKVTADEREGLWIFLRGDQGGGQLQSISGAHGMYAQQAYRPLTKLVRRLDLDPRSGEGIETL